MNFLPNLAARVIGTPLLVESGRLETILAVLGNRIDLSADWRLEAVDGREKSIEAPSSSLKSPGSSLSVTPNGIAVIPIQGTLVKRGSHLNAPSGLMSYDAIEEMILNAATDPKVRGILLDVDSPGGEVGGVFDLADLIHEAREVKPVWAVADDAFSAACLLASAAERIYVSRTGGVGSIGVIAVHVDESEKDAREGRRYATVFAGDRKADLSPHQPLSDDARQRLQAEVDRLYAMFVASVARFRGLDASAVKATEAALFFGQNAVSIGLADRLGTFRDALADLSALLAQPRKLPRTPMSKSMSQTAVSEPATVTVADDAPTMTITGEPPPFIELEAANEIVELCGLVEMPQLAGGFIAKGMNASQVRRELQRIRAQGPEIHSQVLPGDGTRVRPETNLESNPVIHACKRLALRDRRLEAGDWRSSSHLGTPVSGLQSTAS